MMSVRPAPEFATTPLPVSGSDTGSFVASNGAQYDISVLTSPELLEASISEWQLLAAQTVDPNPFYEPWFFLPAVRHLGAGVEWRVLLVYASEKNRPGQRQLCGFFPFVRAVGPGKLKLWTLWKNEFCFLTSPLIDKGRTTDVLRAVYQFIREPNSQAASMEFPLLASEGPVHHSLTELVRENLAVTFMPDQYLRAVSTCKGDVAEYFKQTLGGHHVREYRRGRRKLEALGQLEYRQLQDSRGLTCWVDWFLDLEAQGWKARAKTAIKLHDDQTAFFREMVAAGFERGQVRLEGLFLKGEPIALKCVLIARPVAFAFKIAFDESYHSSSPGVQLEFESLQRFAEDPELTVFDSCAAPGHQMIDRLWSERRCIRHLIVSNTRCSSDLMIGALPFFRAMNRVRKRWMERLSSSAQPAGQKSKSDSGQT